MREGADISDKADRSFGHSKQSREQRGKRLSKFKKRNKEEKLVRSEWEALLRGKKGLRTSTKRNLFVCPRLLLPPLRVVFRFPVNDISFVSSFALFARVGKDVVQ